MCFCDRGWEGAGCDEGNSLCCSFSTNQQVNIKSSKLENIRRVKFPLPPQNQAQLGIEPRTF